MFSNQWSIAYYFSNTEQLYCFFPTLLSKTTIKVNVELFLQKFSTCHSLIDRIVWNMNSTDCGSLAPPPPLSSSSPHPLHPHPHIPPTPPTIHTGLHVHCGEKALVPPSPTSPPHPLHTPSPYPLTPPTIHTGLHVHCGEKALVPPSPTFPPHPPTHLTPLHPPRYILVSMYTVVRRRWFHRQRSAVHGSAGLGCNCYNPPGKEQKIPDFKSANVTGCTERID